MNHIPESPVAIVGSRMFRPMDMVRLFVANLPGDTHLISGGAVGVDMVAEVNGLHRGLWVRSYRPMKDDLLRWRIVEYNFANGKETVMWLKGIYPNFSKAAHTRNQMIVNNAGSVVAFWDGKSKGTKSTIDKAEAAGILFAVYTPDSVTPST